MAVASYVIPIEVTDHGFGYITYGPPADVLALTHTLPGWVRSMAHGDGPNLAASPYLVEADDFAALDAHPRVVRVGPAAASQAALMAALDTRSARPLAYGDRKRLIRLARAVGVSLEDWRTRTLGDLLRRVHQRVEPAIRDDSFDQRPETSKQTITDNFNRASLGSDWSSLAGSWAIVSSTYAAPAGTYAITSCIRTESSFPNDHYAQNKTETTGTVDFSFGGIAVRMTDASNYYFAYLSSVNGYAMYKRVAASNSYLTDAGVTAAADTLYTLKLNVTGTGLTAYQDGVSKLTATDSALASGKPGMFQLTGSTIARHDDFESTDATAAPSGARHLMLLGIGT